MTNQKYYALHK